MIHNLVFYSFKGVEKTEEGLVVDHIDGNKLNNALVNLREITLSENSKNAFYTQKTNSSVKCVGQYSKDGRLIQTFPSIAECARVLSLDSSTITKVCKGKNKSHGGFVFKYL